ncbi:MAG: hydantoinase/oxoprolinase family protein [Candidatus Verstraetearchaeota archaeon]|nr:hydantoinase/oxoprolinase family protein [Candidatus Verstraetearchaeota archaeon]
MFGVGISSGGSFTDAVIMDLKDWRVIAKAKSPTTYQDFSLGIISSLDKVLLASQIPADQVGLVSLATTLATNAIIEGRGGRIGLILIGIKHLELVGLKPETARDLPVHSVASIVGGHGPDGIEAAPLDVGGVREAVKHMLGEVDGFAVSGLFSVRNPEHELTVKRMIAQTCSKPVVCGHELAGSLGIYERTVTAVLNARIIPIIERLMKEVKGALAQRGISAPLMLVRGDGALMNEAVALERAIETIQSGPAASVIGGKFLASKDDVVVMDIGSTTTIISTVKAGTVKTDESGATISGWKTRVRAVDADALGNGGDSRIWIDDAGRLKVGPRRVMPLAFASIDFPTLKEKIAKSGSWEFINASKAMRKVDGSELINRFIGTVSRLEPITLDGLKNELSDVPVVDHLFKTLDEAGFIARIGLTPTDLMHIKGLFPLGDIEAARMGAELLAKTLGITAEELFDRVWKIMVHKITLRLTELQNSGGASYSNSADQSAVIGVLESVVSGALGDLKISCTLNSPIVGIGAPAHLFIPQVAKELNTEAIIPPNHEVGAAIGALIGNVASTSEFLIKKEMATSNFVVFPGRHVFTELEPAVEFTLKMGKEVSFAQAKRAGAAEIEFRVERKDKVVPNLGFMWSEIKVTATGRPSLEGREK